MECWGLTLSYPNQIAEKLKEADFFLEKMVSSNRRVDELNYYFSAFASAARSVTVVLQYVGSSIEGFDEWYSGIRARLGGDIVSKYLLEARNESLKTGIQPISYGLVVKLPTGEEDLLHFFSYIGLNPPAEVPDIDALSTCRHQMKNLVAIVSEFFERFESVAWNPLTERSDTLKHLNQAKPLIPGGANAEALWEQTIAFISRADFQPPYPSEAIRNLVAKYA